MELLGAGSKGISFVTAINYASSVLKAFNSMTFLYNPSWEYGKTTSPVFPISLFYVASMHEIQDSDISEKPVLFYNGANNSKVSSTSVNTSLNVVSDNIVTRPKEYSLELILPATIDDYLSLQNYKFDASTYADIAFTLSGSSNLIGDTSLMGTVFSISVNSVNLLRKLLSMLTSINFSSSSLTDDGFLRNVLGASREAFSNKDYNKEAFVEMCGSRSILKMKPWNSWRYKYVAVTSYDVDKKPTEKNVYRATLKLSEIPIMTLISDRSKGYKENAWSNDIIYYTNDAISRFVNDSEV